MKEKNSSFFSWDSFLSGLLIGSCVPILGFALIQILFDTLASFGLMDYASSSGAGPREKTIGLLAICCNIIPFNIFKNRRMDYALRGCVLPTMLFVGYWLYRYKEMLFSF